MSSRIITLLKLRMRQSVRMVSTVGWSLGLIFLFVSIGILFPAFDRIVRFEAWYSVIFCVILLFTIGYIRKDTFFLISIFTRRRLLHIYLTFENVLVTLPFWIFQFSIGQYVNGALIFFVCLLSSFASPAMDIRDASVSKKSLSFIKLTYYEFKFYIEGSSYLSMLLWFVGFISFFHIGFYIFWIFVILMMLPEVFRQYENRDMLHWHENFIRNKILSYIGLFLLVIALQSVTALIFHFDKFWILMYCIVCLMTAIFMNISIKYAGYTPMYSSRYGQNTSGILTMLMIIPGGVLIVIAYSLIKYFKAKSNLQSLYA